MTILEAFEAYIAQRVPLSLDADVVVSEGEDTTAVVTVSGVDSKAMCIANSIHEMLCRCAGVEMSGYSVALAYSTLYEPEKVDEFEYLIPVNIQYTLAGA